MSVTKITSESKLAFLFAGSKEKVEDILWRIRNPPVATQKVSALKVDLTANLGAEEKKVIRTDLNN